ncbi:hypothetical protein GCM10009678_86450 [Actinomadura kijaniata]|uniref:Uncharacterized protein n=1 Tax=Actinomadura namibiensis TaxID=182080 RepID=A0A7W3QSG7_ACTNM|nr:hypothetical protein [Actinomadura namibiensis]MBA8957701.1 hypothetical protein [Actinomadura namibiensis]
MARRPLHTMTKIRWLVLTVGTLALALTVALADSVTALFVAGYAWTLGAATLLIAEWIIARTRNHPQVRMANARAGSLER